MECKVSELVKRGHDQVVELKSSCGAVDVRDVAQLISDLASQLDVQRVRVEESRRELRAADATSENLKMQVEKLAAENANCRKAVQVFCDVVDANTDAICEEVGQDGVKAILAAMSATGNMPATDAFLAEVRAQGVEMFAAWNDKHIKKGVEHKESLTAVSHAARGLAEQIRKGVQP